MSNISTTSPPQTKAVGFAPLSLPLSVWMLLLAALLGIAAGMGNDALIRTLNQEFGRAIGDFAVLLLPSFIISCALAKRSIGGAAGLACALGPLAGAGMVCPDTAYAALAPMAGKRKVEMALGAYAGFKLLFPAGPLIVATGIGLEMSGMMYVWSVLLFTIVYSAGFLFLRLIEDRSGADIQTKQSVDWVALLPFLVLSILLLLGTTRLGTLPIFDIFTHPRGALVLAAVVAFSSALPNDRTEIMQNAVRRTALLLFVLGTASALGGMLTTIIPFQDYLPKGLGSTATVIMLFGGASIFKLLQGSSMATFAAISAVAGPIIAFAGLSPTAGVLAICLGTFVAIAPNDSFYWLVRTDALASEGEGRVVRLLTVTSIIQGITGLGALLLAMSLGLLSN